MQIGLRRLDEEEFHYSKDLMNQVFYNSTFLKKFEHFPSLKINLHLFLQKSIEEFDVSLCESFCEQPGQWIEFE